MATLIFYVQRKLIEELDMKKLVIIVFGFGLLFASTAQARYGGGYDDYGFDDRFHKRQERQHRRIDKGIQNDVLSHREIEKLRCEQDEIAKLERRFLRDGWFSNREQRKLQRKLNKASNRIYKYKHNQRVNNRNYRDDYRHNDHYRYGGTSGIRIGGENSGFYLSW
jgi:hypothetical protein